MKVTKKIHGLSYTYDNELFVIIKRSNNSQPLYSANSYFYYPDGERCLEFAGTANECKRQLMNIASFISNGLYMDEPPIPYEDWYKGIGIYECLEEEGIRLVYSIDNAFFKHGNDKYAIFKVDDEVDYMCNLGKEQDFFKALMNLKDVEMVDAKGKRVIGYPNKLLLKCKEYNPGITEKECQKSIFSELWRKRMEVNNKPLTHFEPN